MTEGVEIDVVADRARRIVDGDKPMAGVAAPCVWTAVLVERQAPFDIGSAPAPHDMGDLLEVCFNLITDPCAARMFGLVIFFGGIFVGQSPHHAGRAAIAMPGDTRDLFGSQQRGLRKHCVRIIRSIPVVIIDEHPGPDVIRRKGRQNVVAQHGGLRRRIHGHAWIVTRHEQRLVL